MQKSQWINTDKIKTDKNMDSDDSGAYLKQSFYVDYSYRTTKLLNFTFTKQSG